MARIIDSVQKNMVGDNVRRLRKALHLSQQQVSDRLETYAIYICRGSMSRIEDKSRTVTDIEIYGLAKVLGVDICVLFSNAEEFEA